MMESDGRGLIAEHQATPPCQAATGENNQGTFDYFCFEKVLLILLMAGNFCVVS